MICLNITCLNLRRYFVIPLLSLTEFFTNKLLAHKDITEIGEMINSLFCKRVLTFFQKTLNEFQVQVQV